MLFGYCRMARRKDSSLEYRKLFSVVDVEQLFIDSYSREEVYPRVSKFTELIEHCQSGDTIVDKCVVVR